MPLQLELSDLNRLDRIRDALARNDPRGQFTALGMGELTIADGAADADGVVAAVERPLALAGRPAGPDTFPRLDAAVLTHPHPREAIADVLGPAGAYNAVRSLQLAVRFCDAELVCALDVLPRLESAILVGAVLARG